MNPDLHLEIENLKARNKRVELDKAWEVSWTRRAFVVVVTYVVATLWLYVIDESQLFLKACVPVLGYILSTLSLPQVKSMWLKKQV